MKETHFLFLLEKEAFHQAKLEKHPLLPARLSRFARFFVLHSWQVLVFFSALVAVFSTIYEIPF